MINIFLGELIGTAILVLLGNGVIANVRLKQTKGTEDGWLTITFGWGVAIAIAIFIIGWATGGHVNPAITLGMWFAGKTPADQIFYYFAGQLTGGIIGALFVYLVYYQHFQKTHEHNAKLLSFATSPGIRNYFWNFLSELIGTALFLVGILSIVHYQGTFGTGAGPFLVGLLVFGIGVCLGGGTGYAINPARDIGPRIAYQLLPIPKKGSADWAYSWVPVLGPLAGAILGALLYTTCIQTLLPYSP